MSCVSLKRTCTIVQSLIDFRSHLVIRGKLFTKRYPDIFLSTPCESISLKAHWWSLVFFSMVYPGRSQTWVAEIECQLQTIWPPWLPSYFIWVCSLKDKWSLLLWGCSGWEVIGTWLRTKIFGCGFNPQPPMPAIFHPQIAKKSTSYPQSG